MSSFLQTAAAFVFALGVLVSVHEYGHFWVARRLGVKILRFSLGFGKPLWLRRFGPDGTEFAVASIPLGGYVRMLDEREGPVAPEERARAFNTQSLSVRAAIVLAGPLANFAFAFVAYWMMYLAGVSGPRPIIGEVEPASIAYEAGLRSGFEITAVDGRETHTWDNMFRSSIRAVLDRRTVELTVQTTDGGSAIVRLGFAGVSLDDVTQGDFFAKVGFRPFRPEIPPVLGKVLAGEPAARAGLLAGDRVVSADGKPIDDWFHWVDYIVKHPEQPIAVVVRRGSRDVAVTVVPRLDEEKGVKRGRIGAELDRAAVPKESVPLGTERYSLFAAAGRGAEAVADTTVTTLKFLGRMLVREASLQNLSGPISIAQIAGQSAQLGPSRFLEFLGLVSVSLGVLNLMPIPMLDGGHLLYYLIESIMRRPMPETVQVYGQQVGMLLLLGLMGLAMYFDIMRIL
ncbi:MAG: RIP metalloprotease RseP [Gammaproteobacteria bacterium]|nr:RIP metalloprotease RseP [Gammaproteobacteria bacterium]MBI5617295.1 RIP metalloprotease RseP [Gammaproteobacteria bacterium]